MRAKPKKPWWNKTFVRGLRASLRRFQKAMEKGGKGLFETRIEVQEFLSRHTGEDIRGDAWSQPGKFLAHDWEESRYGLPKSHAGERLEVTPFGWMEQDGAIEKGSGVWLEAVIITLRDFTLCANVLHSLEFFGDEAAKLIACFLEPNDS